MNCATWLRVCEVIWFVLYLFVLLHELRESDKMFVLSPGLRDGL